MGGSSSLPDSDPVAPADSSAPIDLATTETAEAEALPDERPTVEEAAAATVPGVPVRASLDPSPKSTVATSANSLDIAESSQVHPGWRLNLALLLTVPLVAVVMINHNADGAPISTAIGRVPFLILQAALAIPVVFICGWPILTRGWRTIRNNRPDFYSLVTFGIGAALIFSLVAMVYDFTEITLLPKPVEGENVTPVVAAGLEAVAPFGSGSIAPFFEGAAVMVVLVLIGLALEDRARSRTGESIRKLVRLTPKSARVLLPNGGEEERPLSDVRVGDIVRIAPGERIPVDGMIREGNTTVDESVLTGEAMRSGRGPGMVVIAGTENGLGALTVEVRRVNQDTALAHIIALVGRAQRTRVPLQRTVDRIAFWLIPLAILAGAATYAGWIYFGPAASEAAASVCAIGVLVTACPVALGLAAPTAVVIGMGRASRAGILFRDGAALERLTGIDTVLFDKTGTLTEGKMKLIGVEPNPFSTAEDVLAMAAAVERGSIHPIGLAIVWEASRRQVPFADAENIEEIPGKGIRGTVAGHNVAVGRLGFIQESGAHFELMHGSARSHWSHGHSVVFVSRDHRCIGLIILSDALRPGADTAVAELKAVGVEPILVTGDHTDCANAIAQRVGIDKVVADTMPAEKYAVVQKQKNEGHAVAMCGDGVNDAPALAAADVGIAMGTGTEIAVSTAGIALAQPDLRLLLAARKLSQATVRTIKQNMAIAFIYTALAVPIAAGALFPLGGGLVSPVWQAAGMAITSLIVVANSQKLAKA